MELGLKEESGNVVAGAWARYGLYFEWDEKNTKKREGKGGAALYDSPSPRW